MRALSSSPPILPTASSPPPTLTLSDHQEYHSEGNMVPATPASEYYSLAGDEDEDDESADTHTLNPVGDDTPDIDFSIQSLPTSIPQTAVPRAPPTPIAHTGYYPTTPPADAPLAPTTFNADPAVPVASKAPLPAGAPPTLRPRAPGGIQASTSLDSGIGSPSLLLPGMGGSVAGDAPSSKRLSFISYADLLNSTPAALVPLESLTNPSSDAEPPHIPALGHGSPGGPGVGAGSPSSQTAPVGMGLLLGGAMPNGPGGPRDSILLVGEGGFGEAAGGSGEWGREGLGRGLEERLDGLGLGVSA